MSNEVEFSGDFEFLDDVQQDLVSELFVNFYPKVKRMLNNEVSFEVSFKMHKQLGARKKFAIRFRVVAPTDIFEVSAADWDLARTVHKACNKMSTEIEGRLHVSDR
jgi:hypothetical protein